MMVSPLIRRLIPDGTMAIPRRLQPRDAPAHAGAAITLEDITISATGQVLISGAAAITIDDLTVAAAGAPFYPSSEAQIAAAAGFGTWTGGAGWLFNETSGNAIPAFGGANLVPANSPTQNGAGPRGGIDKCVSLSDNSSQYMSGGDIFDVGATDDFIMIWVAKHSAAPSGTRVFMSKRGVSTAYWSVQMASGAGGGITGVFTDATISTIPGTVSSANHINGTWYVGCMVLERGVGSRVATSIAGAGTSETVQAALLGNCGNANAISLTGRTGSVVSPVDLAAVWINTGVGIAASCNANIATICSNVKAYLGI